MKNRIFIVIVFALLGGMSLLISCSENLSRTNPLDPLNPINTGSGGTEVPININSNNPSFETWSGGISFTNPTSDGNMLSDMWQAAWGGGGLPCNVVREGILKTDGSYSLKVTMSGSGVSATSWGIFTKYAGYTAYIGKRIRLKADVYCSVANKASLVLTYYNDRHNPVISSYATNANAWTPLSVDSVVPADAINLQIHFGGYAPPANNEVYIFDNVKLYEVTAP